MVLGLSMATAPAVPAYFDALIAAYRGGQVGRDVHLGWWDRPPSVAELAQPQAFEAAQLRLLGQVLRLADLQDGMRVLDIGCGFGGTAQALNQRWRKLEIWGLNVDIRQLAICRELSAQHGNRLHWVQADACALPLAGASVDRVLCIEAMFHFGSRRQFFFEAARVLRPGGVLAVSDIVPRRSPPEAMLSPTDAAAAAAVSGGFGPWPDFWSCDADHDALARAAGLCLTHRTDATEATLPSHHYTTPAHAPGDDPFEMATWALAVLHRSGRLGYPLLRFEKSWPAD